MNVFPVALALVTPPPPVVQTKGTGGEWVKIGKNNDFFEQVIALKNGSPTLSRCINTRTRLVKGSGFVVDADKYPKLTAFLKQIKADKLLGSVAGDNATFRGRAYQVIWSKDGKGIAAIHYQRFKQVRSGKYDEDGNVNSYFLSRDWTAIGRQENKPVELMAFSKDADKKKPQLFYRYTESDNIEYYPDPEYWPAANYAQLEKDLSEFHLGNVQNRFTVNTILVTGEEPDAEEDETQQEANKKFEQALEKKFTGATGKNLMVMTGVTNPESTKLLSHTTVSGQDLYNTYAELCEQKILTANGVSSPVVIGLPGKGSLGGNGNELRSAFELYYNTECRSDQMDILEDFKELLRLCPDLEQEGVEALDITTSLPVRLTFSEAVLQDILPASRLRKWIDEPELTPAEELEMQGTAEPNDNGEGLQRAVLEALQSE